MKKIYPPRQSAADCHPSQRGDENCPRLAGHGAYPEERNFYKSGSPLTGDCRVAKFLILIF